MYYLIVPAALVGGWVLGVLSAIVLRHDWRWRR